MQLTKRNLLPWLVTLAVLVIGLLGGLLWAANLTHTKTTSNGRSTAGASKTIIIAGDIACEAGDIKTTANCRSDDTAQLITALKPDAVLTTGDNQYPKGGLESFQNGYDKTWGAFKNSTYPVPGNHDYMTPDGAGYFDYFGSRAGERGKGYYGFSIGDWRLIALNSEIDMSADSAQLSWLTQELDAHKAKCTLVYWHEPRFSTGAHPSDPRFDAVWRILYSHGVDIVVNGHSHDYERFIPQNPDGQYDEAHGIVQFVSGMGGRGTEVMGSPTTTLVTRQNHAFGVLKLTLYSNSAQYQFVPIPAQQTYTDSGTIACHT